MKKKTRLRRFQNTSSELILSMLSVKLKASWSFCELPRVTWMISLNRRMRLALLQWLAVLIHGHEKHCFWLPVEAEKCRNMQ